MMEQIKKEIDELYELLGIKVEQEEQEKDIDLLFGNRDNIFFEKRWDSSFFANSARY